MTVIVACVGFAMVQALLCHRRNQVLTSGNMKKLDGWWISRTGKPQEQDGM